MSLASIFQGMGSFESGNEFGYGTESVTRVNQAAKNTLRQLGSLPAGVSVSTVLQRAKAHGASREQNYLMGKLIGHNTGIATALVERYEDAVNYSKKMMELEQRVHQLDGQHQINVGRYKLDRAEQKALVSGHQRQLQIAENIFSARD